MYNCVHRHGMGGRNLEKSATLPTDILSSRIDLSRKFKLRLGRFNISERRWSYLVLSRNIHIALGSSCIMIVKERLLSGTAHSTHMSFCSIWLTVTSRSLKPSLDSPISFCQLELANERRYYFPQNTRDRTTIINLMRKSNQRKVRKLNPIVTSVTAAYHGFGLGKLQKSDGLSLPVRVYIRVRFSFPGRLRGSALFRLLDRDSWDNKAMLLTF